MKSKNGWKVLDLVELILYSFHLKCLVLLGPLARLPLSFNLMSGPGYVTWNLSWEASVCRHLSKPQEILNTSVRPGGHVVNMHISAGLAKWSCLPRSSPCGKQCSSVRLPMFWLFLYFDFGALSEIYSLFVNRLNGGKCPFSRLHLLLDNAGRVLEMRQVNELLNAAVQKQEQEKEEPQMHMY